MKIGNCRHDVADLRNARSLAAAGRAFAHCIDPLGRHVRPSLQVIFGDRGPPGREQGWVGDGQLRRRILLRQTGDLPQQLPIARNRDLGHAPPQQGVERLVMGCLPLEGYLSRETLHS